MFISSDCFSDVEIVAMIENNGSVGCCAITGKRDVLGYDTKASQLSFDLSDYFYELLDIYTPESELPSNFPKEKLGYIERCLAEGWNIFRKELSENDIKRIMMAICEEFFPSDSPLFREKVGIEAHGDNEYLKENCLTKDSDWESFVLSIKQTNRFHSNHINLEVLGNLFNSEAMQTKIKKNEKNHFIRGRICDRKVFEKKEMGAPPKERASAGRVNSKGIRCLYLTTDEHTALHEIRARDFDYVSIGRFKPKKNLRLVDLSRLELISPFTEGSDFGLDWFALNMPILKKINSEIAKPLRRQDSEIDYLPTQYIADYIKACGFDGICYSSTLNKQGIDYAIFDPNAFSCNEVYLIQVDPVRFTYKTISNV